MIERQEVEALLAYVEMRMASDKVELPPSVSDATLAALCRAWLAAQDAPTVAITECNRVPGAPDFDHGDMAAAVAGLTPGQRVRIVPVEGDQ